MRKSVNMLLAAGAKPNVTDINGASPLTLACEGGNSEIVASLLKAGADAKAAARGWHHRAGAVRRHRLAGNAGGTDRQGR